MTAVPDDYMSDRRRIERMILDAENPETRPHGPIPTIRTVHAAATAFLDQWEESPEAEADREYMAGIRQSIRELALDLQDMHLASLGELVAQRRICLSNEELFTVLTRMLERMDAATREQRADSEKDFREKLGRDTDMKSELKHCIAQQKKDSMRFRQLVEEFETEWPDRMNDPEYRLMMKGEPAELDALNAKLEVRREESIRRRRMPGIG